MDIHIANVLLGLLGLLVPIVWMVAWIVADHRHLAARRNRPTRQHRIARRVK